MITLAPLTNRQREILEFVRAYLGQNGCPPSIREVQAHFGFHSPNGVMGHYRSLKKKGLLRQTVTYGNRCYVPVVPEGSCPCCGRPLG